MPEQNPTRPWTTRLVLCVGALFMGLLVGSITTVAHQNVATVFGIDIPWGMILSLIVLIGFLVGLRIVVQDRLILLCAALGIIGMVFLLSLRSLGGSVLVPNNLLGTIWAIAPTLIAIVVVAWPKLPEHRRGENISS